VLPYLAGKAGDLKTVLRGREGLLNSAATTMSGQHHYYTSQRAEDRLGYNPRDVMQSIEDAWRWFTEYGFVESKAASATTAGEAPARSRSRRNVPQDN